MLNLDKYKYLFLLFILFTLILLGCRGCLQTSESNVKIELSDREIQLEKDLSNQYNCKVEFGHSPLVLKNKNETDADFYIVFRDETKNVPDSYCKRDTLFLDSISRLIALKVYSIMNYQKNYSRINIIYKGSDDCSQLIDIPVKNILVPAHK